VTDPETVAALLRAAEAATFAYCPDLEALERDAGVPARDVLRFDPTTRTNRPAHVLMRDVQRGQLTWAFRGTTDLNDILADLAAVCTPYCGGSSHWGMTEAAAWFAAHELPRVREILDREKIAKLQLVGHSLGAGTAAMLCHWCRNDPAAKELMRGVEVTAVGVATPAVLSAELAQGCSDYVTSIVSLHDIVPRFSIHAVFALKDEMDATGWGDKLAALAADYAVPDAVERSKAYQRLAEGAATGFGAAAGQVAAFVAAVVAWFLALLQRLGLARGEALGRAAGRAAGARRAATLGKAVEAAAAAGGGAGRGHPDVVPVFAPGKLYFLDRRDPPKEEADALRARQQAARDDARQALKARAEEREAAGAAGASLPSGGADAALDSGEDEDEVKRAVETARHASAEEGGGAGTAGAGAGAGAGARAAAAGGGGGGGMPSAAAAPSVAAAAASPSPPPLPEVDFYPGAAFTLIEGEPGERFRRIVLRDTCLSDHLTGGTLQGCRQVLQSARREQQQQLQQQQQQQQGQRGQQKQAPAPAQKQTPAAAARKTLVGKLFGRA